MANGAGISPPPPLETIKPGVQPFNIGDSVIILERFSHLYPSGSGIVVAIKPDPFRRIFDEYTIKFPDDSTANVFQFQLVQVDPEN